MTRQSVQWIIEKKNTFVLDGKGINKMTKHPKSGLIGI